MTHSKITITNDNPNQWIATGEFCISDTFFKSKSFIRFPIATSFSFPADIVDATDDAVELGVDVDVAEVDINNSF